MRDPTKLEECHHFEPLSEELRCRILALATWRPGYEHVSRFALIDELAKAIEDYRSSVVN